MFRGLQLFTRVEQHDLRAFKCEIAWAAAEVLCRRRHFGTPPAGGACCSATLGTATAPPTSRRPPSWGSTTTWWRAAPTTAACSSTARCGAPQHAGCQPTMHIMNAHHHICAPTHFQAPRAKNPAVSAEHLPMLQVQTEPADRCFLHSQEDGELVQVLQADEDVANCVRPHPSLPLLATSGIESVIRCAMPLTPLGCVQRTARCPVRGMARSMAFSIKCVAEIWHEHHTLLAEVPLDRDCVCSHSTAGCGRRAMHKRSRTWTSWCTTTRSACGRARSCCAASTPASCRCNSSVL